MRSFPGEGLTYRSVVPTSIGIPLKPLRFSRPGQECPGRPDPPPLLFRGRRKGRARVKPTLRQACSRPRPRAQFAFKDSMIHIICNSHYVSHFAAFFIDTGAKISVVESCLWFEGIAGLFRGERALGFRSVVSGIGWGLVPAGTAGVVGSRLVPRAAPPDLAEAAVSWIDREQAHAPSPMWKPRSEEGHQLIEGSGARGDGCSRGKVFDRCNDPSAGSPTETLLRLLLPLGGRV
jgi:hypothetical protein